jgi:formiminotetrahydrofolate cyclodeaminase
MAASYNVRVNLPDIADAELRASLAAQAREALAAVRKEVERLEAIVEGRLT